MPRLSEKVALITGGAGGIGQAAARLFADEGAHVVLVDREESALETVVRSIGEDKASFVVADVTKPDETQNYVKAAIERWGGIDIYLANAGIEGIVSSIPDYPHEMFDQVMAVNVRGVWLGLKYVIPVMRERGGGNIPLFEGDIGGIGKHDATLESQENAGGEDRVEETEGVACKDETIDSAELGPV